MQIRYDMEGTIMNYTTGTAVWCDFTFQLESLSP